MIDDEIARLYLLWQSLPAHHVVLIDGHQYAVSDLTPLNSKENQPMTKPKQKPATSPAPTAITPPVTAREIEVKALLPAKKVSALRGRLLDWGYTLDGIESQLNWYYKGASSDLERLAESVDIPAPILKADGASVRTRSTDGAPAQLVIKASVDGGTSENGTNRIEHTEATAFSMEALDELLAQAGFLLSSKWSRTRRTYTSKSSGITVCLDDNAGYGCVVECEVMLPADADAAAVEVARALLTEELGGLGLTELPTDRLERMFKHYEANWWEYYGTDKTFEVP